VLKWLIGIGVTGAVLVGGAAVGFFSLGGAEWVKRQFAPVQEATTVQVAEVERGDLVRTVNAPGAIEPETLVDVSAQVSARIVSLPFREGDDVRKGDVIVRLDSEDLQARLDASLARLASERARLEGAKASLRLSEIDYGRMKELYETRDVARTLLDQAEASYEQAKANVAAIEASIKSLEADIVERRKDLANAVVTAPIDGTITKLNSEVGELVLGTSQNIGTVIMMIADLRSMLVRARIDESNVSLVQPGQPAKVYLNAFKDRVFEGEVQRVSLQQQVHRDGTSYVEAELKLRLGEEDRLQTGLTASADIEVETLRGVLKVPSQAVLDRRVDEIPKDIRDASPHVDAQKTFTHVVYRVIDGEAVETPVVIGPSDLTHTVVTAGVSAGDRVVAGPYKVLLSIKHGQKVRDENAPAETGAGAPEAGEVAAEPDAGGAA
jgi:HlyD family secretion protein